jgi:hypothetical protein
MKDTWFPIIGYVPDYLTLPCGWFGLTFKILEDAELILSSFWDYDGGSLMLKRWHTAFDPTIEYVSHRHIWVLLPDLPLNLWNRTALKAIGNLLGRFLKVDEACRLSSDKRLAQILVELDLHVGLMKVIEFEWCGLVLEQRLDYLGLPFQCTLCHRTRHLRKDFFGSCEPSVEEEASEPGFKDSLYMDEEPEGLGDSVNTEYLSTVTPQEVDIDSLLGKLQFYCPRFFHKLSLWERDFLLNSPNSFGDSNVFLKKNQIRQSFLCPIPRG